MFNRWITLLIIAAIIALSAFTPNLAGMPVHADDSCDEADFETDGYTNQIVIKLIDPQDTATLNAIVTSFNLLIDDAALASRGVYLLQVVNGDADDLSDQIEDTWSTELLYVEANYLGDIPEANPSHAWGWGGDDPAPSGTQYVNAMLNLADAHQLSQGAGVTVAVLDTGIQADHPFLATQVVAGYDFIDDDTSPDDVADGADTDGDGTPNEAVGHGTHVAGIVHTVAPLAQIMPVRVLDGDGAGTLFAIAEAILYAAEQGADVISLSLGSVYKSDILEEAVETAVEDYGVVIVAAAGNSNSTQSQYPAAFEDEVLAVTSIDEQSVKAGTANFGCWVDLAAPGEGIFSAFPVDGYAWWGGTSMATPFVAGEAALIISRLAAARNAEVVVNTIIDTAVSIESENPAYAGLMGAGRLNIVTALNTIEANPTQVTLQAEMVSADFPSPLPSLLPLLLLTSVALLHRRLRKAQ